MAITAEMRAQVMELYSAYFNRVIDKAGVDYWLNDMDANGLNIIQISNAFANSDEYKAIYSGLTNEQIVAKVYQNVLNRDGDAAGVAYWTSELDSGAISVENLVLAVITAAKEDKDELGDAMVLANKTAVNNYAFTNNNADKSISLSTITNDPASVAIVTEMIQNSGGSDVTDGDVQILTVSQDILKGTDGNDTFVSYVAQNMLGQQVNTLGSGDVINGGAGVDTLDAQVVAGAWAHLSSGAIVANGMSVAPITNSVENIIIHAESTDHNTLDTVVLNAKYMNGVNKIVSNYSDASLLVQNMTTKGVGSTSKMTVGMEYTANKSATGGLPESDMTVLFDQDYLTRSTVEENALYYFTQDRLSMNSDNKPFGAGTTTVDGLNFTLNGVRKTIIIEEAKLNAFLAAVPADTTAAYQAFTDLLIEALTAAKATDASLKDLQISLDTSFVRTHGGIKNNGDVLKAAAPAITLTAAEGAVLSDPKMHQNDSFLGSYDMFNDIDTNKAVANTPVSINVDLEKVGLTSAGGDLIIGSMNTDGANNFGVRQATTITDTVAGFDEFNVHVAGDKTKNSSLASLHSTDNTLRKVTIDSKGGDANLVIGNANTGAGGLVFNTSANNAQAFKDVQIMNANAFAGKLTLNAGITAEIAKKYFEHNVKLNGLNDGKELAAFDYTGGAGNDELNIAIDANAIAHSFGQGVATVAGAAITKTVDANGAKNIKANKFKMDIKGGAGNDTITVTMDTLANTASLNNDTAVYTIGATGITINGGTGNDVINLTSDTVAKWSYTVAFNGNFGHDTINNFLDGTTATGTKMLSNELQELDLRDFVAHKGEVINVTVGTKSYSFTATADMNNAAVVAAVTDMLTADTTTYAHNNTTENYFAVVTTNVASVLQLEGNTTTVAPVNGYIGQDIGTVSVTITNQVEAAGTYDKDTTPIHSITADTIMQGGQLYYGATVVGTGADFLDFTSYKVKGFATADAIKAADGKLDQTTNALDGITTALVAGDKFLTFVQSAHNADVMNVYLSTATGAISNAAAVDFVTEAVAPITNANATLGTIIGSIDLGSAVWAGLAADQILI